jgi:hypothetical protein
LSEGSQSLLEREKPWLHARGQGFPFHIDSIGQQERYATIGGAIPKDAARGRNSQ